MKPIRYIDGLNAIKNCKWYLTSELFFKDLKLNNDDYIIESAEDVEIVISIIEALNVIAKSYHTEWQMIVEDDKSSVGLIGAVPKGIARTFLMFYVNKQEGLIIEGDHSFISIYSLKSNERVACITTCVTVHNYS